MSDPAEITQQAQNAQQHAPDIATLAGWLGALTAFLGTVAGLWRTLVGSPKERAEAKREEAEATTVIVDAAKDVIEAQREDTHRVRAERDDCTARLAAHEDRSARERAEDRARIAALERGLAEHATCGPRIALLTAENEWMGRGLLAVAAGEPLPERPDTLTPPANPRPDMVRAEMARQTQEETGP